MKRPGVILTAVPGALLAGSPDHRLVGSSSSGSTSALAADAHDSNLEELAPLFATRAARKAGARVMRRALAFALALAATALAATAPPAAAASADFNDVEAALMCDVCNVPLPIAQSPRADQQRAEIRRLIAQGKTKQEILDRFVAEYGPDVLADPKGGGASVTVWLIPTVILVAALLAVVLLVLPRWKRRRGAFPSAAPAGTLSGEDAERVERDLALYDR